MLNLRSIVWIESTVESTVSMLLLRLRLRPRPRLLGLVLRT